MEKRELQELLERYERGECTEKEQAYIERWYLNWKPGAFDLSEKEFLEDLSLIRSALPGRPQSGKLFIRICTAAILVLAMGISFYFIKKNSSEGNAIELAAAKIVPGRNQATLTLSDGTTVLLDTATKMGTINQHGVKVSKTADGKLVYVNTATGKSVDAYNTIKTPNGGRYDIALPDGTLVTLNAASKIKFPIIFSETERRVELEGEAYFEVAKDAKKPFRVVSGKQTVQVLGTRFNVNSYEDEPQIRTTLLEGSILLKGATQVLLKPGEQAITGHRAENFRVANVDVQTEVAWKNNLFFFENEPIENCMRQVARWYNVEIVYEDNVSDKKVWGSMTRFSEISKVLEILELTGDIHFKVAGRRIIVMK
ncbi:FecR family protein [Pedobacter metabolipauper]|uniref:FecR family protein n=1 Tax=Pedobacter metabolipauper TaxID=425513 RepID=A0A4R6ST50_9SPHI|nr:FecR family protein [Pedobacter metabolipauper]TDQ08083.1 FecR family protein [Pedobacter metabolipauper]